MKDGQIQDISTNIESSGVGYYVDTVGKNTKRIKNHIANRLKEDQEREQLTLDLEDPFKKGKGKN